MSDVVQLTGHVAASPIASDMVLTHISRYHTTGDNIPVPTSRGTNRGQSAVGCSGKRRTYKLATAAARGDGPCIWRDRSRADSARVCTVHCARPPACRGRTTGSEARNVSFSHRLGGDLGL